MKLVVKVFIDDQCIAETPIELILPQEQAPEEQPEAINQDDLKTPVRYREKRSPLYYIIQEYEELQRMRRREREIARALIAPEDD